MSGYFKEYQRIVQDIYDIDSKIEGGGFYESNVNIILEKVLEYKNGMQ